MTDAFAVAIVALPLLTAVGLLAVGSWRAGIWINAGAASLQFLIACAAIAHLPPAQSYLCLLTSIVAMTTSWFGPRDIPAALAAQVLDRRRARRYHAGFQAVVGGVQLASLGGSLALSWFGLAVAVGAAGVVTGSAHGAAGTASRLLRHCGTGLTLASLGALLRDPAPELAGLFLLLGYGAIAGLVPFHAWLTRAATDGFAPGMVIVTVLPANAALMLLMREDIEPGLLIGFGLLSLLTAAAALLVRVEARRGVAFAGVGQLGMILCAAGIGVEPMAWLHMMLLALMRAATLQSGCADRMAWLAQALLPLYALYLLAGPALAISAWLLLPLAVGTLLVVTGLLRRQPTGMAIGWQAAPVWAQLVLAALLAFAMPEPVSGWFRMVAG